MQRYILIDSNVKRKNVSTVLHSQARGLNYAFIVPICIVPISILLPFTEEWIKHMSAMLAVREEALELAFELRLVPSCLIETIPFLWFPPVSGTSSFPAKTYCMVSHCKMHKWNCCTVHSSLSILPSISTTQSNNDICIWNHCLYLLIHFNHTVRWYKWTILKIVWHWLCAPVPMYPSLTIQP